MRELYELLLDIFWKIPKIQNKRQRIEVFS